MFLFVAVVIAHYFSIIKCLFAVGFAFADQFSPIKSNSVRLHPSWEVDPQSNHTYTSHHIDTV